MRVRLVLKKRIWYNLNFTTISKLIQRVHTFNKKNNNFLSKINEKMSKIRTFSESLIGSSAPAIVRKRKEVGRIKTVFWLFFVKSPALLWPAVAQNVYQSGCNSWYTCSNFCPCFKLKVIQIGACWTAIANTLVKILIYCVSFW